jgi:hypothetical protein
MSEYITPPPPYTFMAWAGALLDLCRPAYFENRQTFTIQRVIIHPYPSCVALHRHFKQILGTVRAATQSVRLFPYVKEIITHTFLPYVFRRTRTVGN